MRGGSKDGRNWGVTCEIEGAGRERHEGEWVGIAAMVWSGCGGGRVRDCFRWGRVDVMVIWDGFGEPRDESWLVLDAGAWGFIFWGVSVCRFLMGIDGD